MLGSKASQPRGRRAGKAFKKSDRMKGSPPALGFTVEQGFDPMAPKINDPTTDYLGHYKTGKAKTIVLPRKG